MRVYNIKDKKISKFTEFQGINDGFEDTTKELWKKGLSKPEWWFIIEKDGEIFGRVGYWSSKDDKKNIRIFGLLLKWERENVFKIGKKLLNDSLQMMKNKGAENINYQVHSDDSNNIELIKEILEAVGLKNIQQKKSFYLKSDIYHKDNKNDLTFKSLNEVGKDKFINIIKKVTRKTLDKEDELTVEKSGEEEHAINHYYTLKSIENSPKNWFLGYRESKIIGLVIPQKLNNELGAINYIGVIPNERGKNYVSDLLNKGIINLFNRGVDKIVADIDVHNLPMEEALVNAGFKLEKNIYVYDKNLERMR